MSELLEVWVCICILIIIFQWRSHQFLKWKASLNNNGLDYLHDQIQKIALQLKDFDDYKKRVDSLTLRAGFKL